MTGYADTSFLVSLYVADANSAVAQTTALKSGVVLPFTSLHALETRNAIELGVFRNHITRMQATRAWGSVLTDVRAGKLVRTPIDWTMMLRRARMEAGSRTFSIGTRSLDIVHAVCAQSIGAQEFFHFTSGNDSLRPLFV